LGITPVLPGFSGLVPEEIRNLYPTANISQLTTSWNQFPSQFCCNFMLASTDPLFQQIGSDFLKLQRDIFGELATQTHIYNVDTFNENTPFSSDPDYLFSASNAVYEYMRSVDPDAVWLMQGWLFLHDSFWTPTNIANYLAGVPDDAMIVLDLAAEDIPMWPMISANNKPFIWCMLHNYGGRRALYGNLTLLATDPLAVQAEAKELFLGTGLTMEAIDQNPIVYEFMMQMSYSQNPPKVDQWVDDYAVRRYGLDAIAADHRENAKALASNAWKGLLANNYEGETPVCHHYCHRESILTQKPSLSLAQTTGNQAGPLVEVWALFSDARQSTNVSSSVELDATNAMEYDLVDVGRQVLANLFYDYYGLMLAAFYRGDKVNFASIARDMMSLLSDLDDLLSSHRSYLLGNWISSARAWGEDATESDLMDYNARNQITLWGDVGEIDDYAMKQWGGLVGEYYQHRWALFFKFATAALNEGTTFDTNAFQQQEIQIGQTFCRDYSHVFPTEAQGNTLELSRKLQSRWGLLYKPTHGYALFANTTIPGSNLMSLPTWTKNIKQLERLCDSDASCVGFTSDGFLKTSSEGRVSQAGVALFVKNKCVHGNRLSC
jgi:alpha-N-acetylglucosaminidase